MGSREPRSPDTCIPMVSGTAGIPSSAHVSIRIRSIRILFSAWFAFTALDSDERLHSEVSLKQERGYIRTREDVEERGERLQRRTPHKRQLRTVESADDRLERLQRRRQRERQLRTGDRESADDRLTSATDKTTPALSEYIESPDGRLERLQRRRQREGQTEICQRTLLSPCFQLCQKKNWFSRKAFVWMRQAGYNTSRDLPSTKVLW